MLNQCMKISYLNNSIIFDNLVLFKREANIPHKKIVNYSPNNESADKKNVISRIIPFHTMYIMADLSNNKSVLNRERVLCCIKIDSNGMIIMKPDFSHTSYLIYTYGISRGIYFHFILSLK